MSLTSLGFLQVGESRFEPGQFVRTFFEPKQLCDNYVINERTIEGELQVLVHKQSFNAITGTKDFWTLPKSSEEGEHPKFPTAGTAVYAHSYTHDEKDCLNAEWIPIDKIFEHFYHGGAIGIEVVHAALKVLNQKEERLNLPMTELLPERSLGRRYAAIDERFITKDQLKSWESEVAGNFPLTCEAVPNPERPFINIGYCVDDAGEQREYAVRRGLDSQDSICFCWHGGQLFMAVRLGVRATLSRWDGADNLISIEGVAGSLEPDDSTDEKIINRALEETREELGLEPAKSGIKLGRFYTAAEVTAEVSTSVLVEIDPSRSCTAHHSADEIQDTRFIELDDLIRACEEGIVIDERLEVSARLLKALYRYHDPLKLPENKMQHIGFFGGSFDPFHRHHLKIAALSVENLDIDAAIIVPAKQNPHKVHAPMMDTQQRADSIVATVSEYPGLYVSEHEIHSAEPVVFTADSIAMFRKIMPNAKKISLVVGGDLLESMYRWKKFDELLDHIDGFIIAPRDNFTAQMRDSYRHLYTDKAWSLISTARFLSSVDDVSSSGVKGLLVREGASTLDEMLPRRVAKFLK